jgi:MYXO-CTERM domain-containing protein
MRKTLYRHAALAALALAAASPAPVLAQDNAGGTDTQYDVQTREEDDDFPWGLLGLLGLAGLLGLRRKERDIHVDARRP